MEYAIRPPPRGNFLSGLAKCISRDLPWSPESLRWDRIKEAGIKLFAPEKGGKYEVFHERPIPAAISAYCAQDVAILPKLLMWYASRMTDRLAVLVGEESKRRVEASQSSLFNGKGQHMARGPNLDGVMYVTKRSRWSVAHPPS